MHEVRESKSFSVCRHAIARKGTYQPVRGLSQALQELCLDVGHILPTPHHVDGIHQGCTNCKAHTMHYPMAYMYKDRWQCLSTQRMQEEGTRGVSANSLLTCFSLGTT